MKVTESLKQYAELPRTTPNDLECALTVTDESLQISSCSEQLLQTKADTLIMLQRYEPVIQMFEHTLNYADTETPTSSSSWRSSLIVKSYFLLEKLEEAHEFIKKHESSGHITDSNVESSVSS